VDPEVIKHVPGIGGALVAALVKFKDGWRVTIVQFMMGAIPVMSLRIPIEWGAKKWEVPPELLGFIVGGLGVALVTKAIETVQSLNVAGPFNNMIEKWTGAKAPPHEDKP
jgi:hypothetical protein